MSITEARRSKNLTQLQLAGALGVTRSTVAMWESGESLPRADKLPQLAQILGCTIDDLFPRDNKAASGAR